MAFIGTEGSGSHLGKFCISEMAPVPISTTRPSTMRAEGAAMVSVLPCMVALVRNCVAVSNDILRNGDVAELMPMRLHARYSPCVQNQ